MFQDAQSKGLNADEIPFADIVNNERQKQQQRSGALALTEEEILKQIDARFVKRKPRFFNSVKQGYEWNKYN